MFLPKDNLSARLCRPFSPFCVMAVAAHTTATGVHIIPFALSFTIFQPPIQYLSTPHSLPFIPRQNAFCCDACRKAQIHRCLESVSINREFRCPHPPASLFCRESLSVALEKVSSGYAACIFLLILPVARSRGLFLDSCLCRIFCCCHIGCLVDLLWLILWFAGQ